MSVALSDLNEFLSSRSYVDGFVPSQADVAVFEHIARQSVDPSLNHVLRWQRHIASYNAADRTAFPGIKKSVDEYGIKKSAAGAEKKAGGDDDDFDMFGEDDNPEDTKRELEELKQRRIKEAEERQKEKQKVSKSSIVLEVKPYDDEADHEEIERIVRAVEMEGLLWGKSRLEPVAYGVQKLQITAVILDSVSTEILCEEIEKHDEIIQSTDIVSFQKI